MGFTYPFHFISLEMAGVAHFKTAGVGNDIFSPFAYCAANFVVNVMKTIAHSVLMHTLVGTKLLMRRNTCHICYAKGMHISRLMMCDLCGMVGFDPVLLGGLL